MKPLLARRLLAAFVGAVLLVLPAAAGATVVVSDDAMFSLDLGAATVCFVEPPSLRSAADCAGVDLGDVAVPAVVDPLARFAYGVVRGPGQGATRPVVGFVTVLRAPSHATTAPDGAVADAVAHEVAESLAAIDHAAPRPVARPSSIAWGKNVPIVRATFDTDSAEVGKQSEREAHRETLTAVGGRYLYIAMWSGTREHGVELARLADGAATTTDLKPEGRPVAKLNPWPGRVLFFFGVAGLMLLRFRKKRVPPPKP